MISSLDVVKTLYVMRDIGDVWLSILQALILCVESLDGFRQSMHGADEDVDCSCCCVIRWPGKDTAEKSDIY